MNTPLALDLPRFLERFDRLQTEIREIVRARGSGDDPLPRVVVVSKYLTPEDVARLREACDFPLAENRAQALRERASVEDRARWHFIGHLQRNKTRHVVDRIDLLHSVDSERLARAVDSEVGRCRPESPLSVLVQVNVSGEESKGGLDPDNARDSIPRWAAECTHLRFRGLMTMAPRDVEDGGREVFRAVRSLRDDVRSDLPPIVANSFVELSMGMSGDYQVAVEEGATLLRIGRVLFE